jgi:hypothetical protein
MVFSFHFCCFRVLLLLLLLLLLLHYGEVYQE